MNASATGEQDAPAQATDVDAALVELRAAGAAQFDAVGWHFMETLAERAAQAGPLRAALQARLAAVVQTFQQRFDRAQSQAQASLDVALTEHPGAAQELNKLFVLRQFSALHQRITALSGGPSALSALSDLVREINAQSPSPSPPLPGAAQKKSAPPASVQRPENPRIGQFRNTLTKISVAKQVTQALDQAPQNAGPINSHMLVLRSLALMRDASPDYLNRFMGYADTLLQLDEAQFAKAPVKKSAGPAKAGKPAKP